MKCPFCGAWSEVKETRQAPNGRVRRSRECANLHTFPTYESVPNRQRLLDARNRQAERLVLSGLTQTEVAKQLRMPRSELSRHMAAKYPNHDARTAGQLRRWARERNE